MQHDFIAQRCNRVGQRHWPKNTAAFAQYGIRADIGIRADFAAFRYFGACLDNSSRMYAALSLTIGENNRATLAKIKIRVGSHNQVAACNSSAAFGDYNHCACPAVVYFGFVFRVGKKS